jgi:hypothetical protein
MIINIAKTKELVFHRPNPRLQFDDQFDDLSHVYCIEQVKKLRFWCYFQDNLRFDFHVNGVLRRFSLCGFLLKHLLSRIE